MKIKNSLKFLVIYCIITSCLEPEKDFSMFNFAKVDCGYFRSLGLNCDENELIQDISVILNDKLNAKTYLLNLKEYRNSENCYYKLFHSEYPTMFEIPLAVSQTSEQTGLNGNFISGYVSRGSLEALTNQIQEIEKSTLTSGHLILVVKNNGIIDKWKIPG